MKQIINKKAYWGSHTFEATSDVIDGKKVIRIDVIKGFPSFARISEATYWIENKEQLLALSQDETSALRFYTGNLSLTQRKAVTVTKNVRGTSRTREEIENVYVPAIDAFIESFKQPLS